MLLEILFGEIVYKDDKGAICRCWNWREAVRTMFTENTTNALTQLSKEVKDNFGGTIKISILDINNKEIVVE